MLGSSDKPFIICLAGPTASGKTDVAVALTELLPVEIISVDSALVYKGMDIGTGKPDPETLALAPHHLIDICSPADSYSVASFISDANIAIMDIISRNKIPLLVGGTMLYFKGWLDGLSYLPPANLTIRHDLEQKAANFGLAYLHNILATVDPVSAQRIHANDSQRLQRALEVYYITGQSLTDLTLMQNNASPFKASDAFNTTFFALMPEEDRKILHARIARRFYKMLDNGFIEEVVGLRQRGDLHIGLPSMRSVGYRQAWEYLDGMVSYDTMIEKAIAATRQLAKRQMTWIRGTEQINLISTENYQINPILEKIKRALSI